MLKYSEETKFKILLFQSDFEGLKEKTITSGQHVHYLGVICGVMLICYSLDESSDASV